MTSSNGNIFRVTGFVRGINRSPGKSPHKGQWGGALMFYLVCSWMNGWVNNRDAGDLRRHRAHYDVTVMWEVIGFGVAAMASIKISIKVIKWLNMIVCWYLISSNELSWSDFMTLQWLGPLNSHGSVSIPWLLRPWRQNQSGWGLLNHFPSSVIFPIFQNTILINS